MACLPVPNFPTLSHKRPDFRKHLLNTKCVFWFSLQIFVWKFSHSKKNWARYDKNCIIGLHVKYRILFSKCFRNWIFCAKFKKKNSQISNFTKIHPVGAKLKFQTDMRSYWKFLKKIFRTRSKIYIVLIVTVCYCILYNVLQSVTCCTRVS